MIAIRSTGMSDDTHVTLNDVDVSEHITGITWTISGKDKVARVVVTLAPGATADVLGELAGVVVYTIDDKEKS